MASFSFSNVHIAGIACAVPTKNTQIMDFSEQFGEKELKKFIKNTGVCSKFDKSKNQTTADFCVEAAKALISKKSLDVKSIDACVFVTQTADYIQPATAHVIHKRLGLKTDCMVYDVNLGCSGYIYALQMCASLLQNGDVNRVLLLTGEILREHTGEITKDDLLFGNAGTATIIEKGNERLRCILKSDGTGYDVLIIRGGGVRHPYQTGKEDDVNPFMDGAAVFEFTISRVPEVFDEFYNKYNVTSNDYDYVILHQANLFMLKHIAKKIGIPKEKMPIAMDRFGNTSSASIPLTIVDLCENNDLKGKLNLIASGFGIGLSWGVADFTIDPDDVLPMIYTDEYYKEAY